MDKHSSLLQLSVSDEEKSLIKLVPGANLIKLSFYVTNSGNK
jgi:hypothetical protein